MLPILLCLPFVSVASKVPSPEDADELYRRRITPIVQVARDASPAVVYIENEGMQVVRDPWRGFFYQQFSGAGSGFVIKKEGFIITNYHVVKGAQRLKVTFRQEIDTTEYKANIVSYDAEEDLALLKIEGAKEFPTIPLGTSKDLMLGETVIAIGNPYGQTHTVVQGIISGLHRDVKIPAANLKFAEMIQTDAPINPGNSGGPLLNINGEVIGINSAMNEQAQNIGFAIPVDRVRTVFLERLTSLDSAPTWLGFEVAPDHLQVADVIAGSPAAQAGLKTGDCIVGIGNQHVESYDDYRLARLGLSPDRQVELSVENDGKKRHLMLQPWNRVDGILFSHLGLRAETQYSNLGSQVQVTEVRKGSPAEDLGLKRGDILDAVRVGRGQSWRVFTHENLAEIISGLAPGTRMEIDVFRDVDKNGRITTDELFRGTMTVR